MLHVPELKPGEQPFDPDFAKAMNPWKEGTLALQGTSWINEPPSSREPTPEEQIQMFLNLAVVKEAVTQFHKDEDAHLRRLETYTSTKICDIVTDHEAFLKNAAAAGETACGSEERKALFRTMTAAFITQSRERSLLLQGKLAETYWKTSVEEQNAELLSRALREENITNDNALTLYRDLIFYNVENMLGNLPEEEKHRKLDAAGAAFYEKILEKRLERDPRGALAMTGEGEIRRTLGEEACAALEARAKTALREQELERIADSWVREAVSPPEAEEKAQTRFGVDAEREYALRRYHTTRFEENRNIVSATIANISGVWEGIKEQGFEESALPGWAVRNNPALADCLRECLRRRADAGGNAGRMDYKHLMAFLRKCQRSGLRGAMESLREAEKCYALLLAAGGPDSGEWVRCVRFLGGVAEERDGEWISALRLAWGEAGRTQEFMERFSSELRREEAWGALRVLELIGKIEESFPEI